MDSACKKLGTETGIIDKRLEILRETFPFPSSWKATLDREKDKLERLSAVYNDFIDFAIEIRKSANKACNTSQRDVPNLNVVNASVTQTINGARFSQQGIEFLQTLSSELKTSLSTPLQIVQSSYWQQLATIKSDRLKECRSPGIMFRNWDRANSGRSQKQTLADLSREVKSQLRKAKLANFKELDSYDIRLQEAISVKDEIVKISNRYEACKKKYILLKDECNKLDGELDKKIDDIKKKVFQIQKNNAQERSNKLTLVNKRETSIQDITIAILKFVVDAKNCLKVAHAKVKSKGPSPILVAEAAAIKVSCNRRANSANIAKLSESRFSKVPGVRKKISDLRRVNSVLAQEVAASADAVTAYRNGKVNDAIASLNRARSALLSISSLLHCPALEAKTKTRKAKAIRFQTALTKVERVISGCRRGELKKVLGLYGKDTHPVLKKKMSRVREQLQLLQKFLEAGNAYRNNKIDKFFKIMQQVNGKGVAISCGHLDKKAQRQIQMIERARKDKIRVPILAVACRMSALRKLQRRYRRESGTITLVKEIYEAAVDAIKDCKRKERERRAEEEKAQKAKEEAEKAKKEIEGKARVAAGMKDNSEGNSTNEVTKEIDKLLSARPTCDFMSNLTTLDILKNLQNYIDPDMVKYIQNYPGLKKLTAEFERSVEPIYYLQGVDELYKKALVGVDGKADDVTPVVNKFKKAVESFSREDNVDCNKTMKKISVVLNDIKNLRDVLNELNRVTLRCDKIELKQTASIYIGEHNYTKKIAVPPTLFFNRMGATFCYYKTAGSCPLSN